MEHFFQQSNILYTAGMYSVVVIALIIFLVIFDLVTKYKTWEEIKKGNVAVSLATGGKVFGVANVFRYSIMHNDSVMEMLAWGTIGFILLIFVYFIFEFLTPGFKVDEELEKDNRAVGFLSFILSISLSFIIGATIL